MKRLMAELFSLTLSLNLQIKLLRLVQERVFMAIGSTEGKQVDIRIIAATNKNLKEMVQKEFRQDLYYRLNMIPIMLPPLREPDFQNAH